MLNHCKLACVAPLRVIPSVVSSADSLHVSAVRERFYEDVHDCYHDIPSRRSVHFGRGYLERGLCVGGTAKVYFSLSSYYYQSWCASVRASSQGPVSYVSVKTICVSHRLYPADDKWQSLQLTTFRTLRLSRIQVYRPDPASSTAPPAFPSWPKVEQLTVTWHPYKPNSF